MPRSRHCVLGITRIGSAISRDEGKDTCKSYYSYVRLRSEVYGHIILIIYISYNLVIPGTSWIHALNSDICGLIP